MIFAPVVRDLHEVRLQILADASEHQLLLSAGICQQKNRDSGKLDAQHETRCIRVGGVGELSGRKYFPFKPLGQHTPHPGCPDRHRQLCRIESMQERALRTVVLVGRATSTASARPVTASTAPT